MCYTYRYVHRYNFYRKNVDSKEEDSKVKLKVTMVSWDATDQWIVTACSDYSLKVWDSFTGSLIQLSLIHI